MLRAFFLWLLSLTAPATAFASPLLADPMAESFAMAQRGYASSAGNALRQIALRAAATDPALAPSLRARQDQTEALARAERALADALAANDPRAVARLSAEAAALRNQIAALEADIARRFDGFASLAAPNPLTLDQARALLAPDEALLFTFVAKDTTFVWFLRQGFTVWHRFPHGQADLAQVVQEIRAGLGVTTTPTRAAAPLDDSAGPGLPVFRRDLTQALYRLLLQPVGDGLAGVTHLIAVTDGPLAALPLHLLTTEAEDSSATSDPEALRQTAWLIRDMAITTLPSVESLAALRANPPAPRQENPRLFAMGDPVLGRALAQKTALTRGGLGDPAAIAALAPLPGTARELRSIAAQFAPEATTLKLAAEATETALNTPEAQAALSQADVVVFATHGLVSGELGLTEPALVLTPPEIATSADDGLLSASEIAGLSLSASWVILSACNTAASDGRADADGFSGLTRAFLLAGARGLLVSHWPVRDDAAARLTTTALAEMGAAPEGQPLRRAEALRRAMLALMADSSDDSLAHPFAWAPFAMVGEGGY
ncbi:CHAT domain-containing protein [Pseudorhodobacter sp. E13]|uniref:CHAT domain-containing protein n=1 Tax=Pseudorhodobacter sp. E13 TaxID=2487931 RepID=UPI000F8ED333|nr:CHAT domain-containing protein [Pseudorhodobacter sp. E13]RUS59410.1 CHAT domain-containing protein [Pseudorhodobacter sp. E13]